MLWPTRRLPPQSRPAWSFRLISGAAPGSTGSAVTGTVIGMQGRFLPTCWQPHQPPGWRRRWLPGLLMRKSTGCWGWRATRKQRFVWFLWERPGTIPSRLCHIRQILSTQARNGPTILRSRSITRKSRRFTGNPAWSNGVRLYAGGKTRTVTRQPLRPQAAPTVLWRPPKIRKGTVNLSAEVHWGRRFCSGVPPGGLPGSRSLWTSSRQY